MKEKFEEKKERKKLVEVVLIEKEWNKISQIFIVDLTDVIKWRK